MSNTQAICDSFKVDLLNAVHAFGSPPAHTVSVKDSFKAALYLASATVDRTTTAYSTTGEVTGTGYTAGGVAITNATAPVLDGTAPSRGAVWTPSASIVYTGVTLATSFDAVLVYNDTATGKNAVSVHTFGAQTITAGTLTLTMPANAYATALIALQ